MYPAQEMQLQRSTEPIQEQRGHFLQIWFPLGWIQPSGYETARGWELLVLGNVPLLWCTSHYDVAKEENKTAFCLITRQWKQFWCCWASSREPDEFPMVSAICHSMGISLSHTHTHTRKTACSRAEPHSLPSQIWESEGWGRWIQANFSHAGWRTNDSP